MNFKPVGDNGNCGWIEWRVTI